MPLSSAYRASNCKKTVPYERRIEEEQINQMLSRALKARDRRDYDECILLCEQVMRVNRADLRAHELLVAARRERHVYLRQITADKWDEEHRLLSEDIRSSHAATARFRRLLG